MMNNLYFPNYLLRPHLRHQLHALGVENRALITDHVWSKPACLNLRLLSLHHTWMLVIKDFIKPFVAVLLDHFLKVNMDEAQC